MLFIEQMEGKGPMESTVWKENTKLKQMSSISFE